MSSSIFAGGWWDITFFPAECKGLIRTERKMSILKRGKVWRRHFWSVTALLAFFMRLFGSEQRRFRESEWRSSHVWQHRKRFWTAFRGPTEKTKRSVEKNASDVAQHRYAAKNCSAAHVCVPEKICNSRPSFEFSMKDLRIKLTVIIANCTASKPLKMKKNCGQNEERAEAINGGKRK